MPLVRDSPVAGTPNGASIYSATAPTRSATRWPARQRRNRAHNRGARGGETPDSTNLASAADGLYPPGLSAGCDRLTPGSGADGHRNCNLDLDAWTPNCPGQLCEFEVTDMTNANFTWIGQRHPSPYPPGSRHTAVALRPRALWRKA